MTIVRGYNFDIAIVNFDLATIAIYDISGILWPASPDRGSHLIPLASDPHRVSTGREVDHPDTMSCLLLSRDPPYKNALFEGVSGSRLRVQESEE